MVCQGSISWRFHLQKADAESIYTALNECLKQKKTPGEQNCGDGV